ncbi:MAG: hypothetical protein GF401_04985 [Chitinivibrionales bacterium]|nr:hypothetical protein [Chitinivibrionales bacterium]
MKRKMKLTRKLSVTATSIIGIMNILMSIATAQQLTHECLYIGNDYPSTDHINVPHNVADLFVASDGTAFTNVGWEESGSNVSIINSDGTMTSRCWVGNRGGGNAVTANSDYIYFAGNNHRTGNQGVDRRDRSDPNNTNLNVHVDCGDRVYGLAVNSTRVYASVKSLNTIKVYDLSLHGKSAENISVTSPEDLYFDGEGTLWVLQPSTNNVLRYDVSSKSKVDEISLASGIVPTDIAIYGTKLYVTDVGADYNVKIYKDITTSPAYDGTFGNTGGIYSGTRGEYAAKKLDNPHGIGFDSTGNMYIANRPGHEGSSLFQKYNSSGNLLWDLKCLIWIEAVSPDPRNENVWYGSEEIMEFDFSTGDWSYIASTIDEFTYPDDPRGGHPGATWLRMLSNQLFMFVGVMNGTEIDIFRYDGYIAVPAGYVTESEIWYDSDGDGHIDTGEKTSQSTGTTRGFYVDSNGDIWQASQTDGIFKYPLQRIDANGVPEYNLTSRVEYGMPSHFNELRRIKFYPEQNNLMVLSGFNSTYPKLTGWHFKRAGRIFSGFENWSGTFSTPDWEIVPPLDDAPRAGDGNIQGMEVLDGYVFLAPCGNEGNISYSRGHLMVYKTDGTDVGYMEPTAEMGTIGWLDITEPITVSKLSNGEYLIAIEDDWRSKNLFYKWCPNDNCSPVVSQTPYQGANRANPSPAFSFHFRNGKLTIHFSERVNDEIEIIILDACGKQVRKLNRPVSGKSGAWDLRDNRNSPVPSGMYFIQAGDGAYNDQPGHKKCLMIW